MLGHSWRKWCRFEAVGHEYTNPMAILFRMFLVTNMWNHHNICSRPWFCKCRLSNLNIKFLNPFFWYFWSIHMYSLKIFTDFPRDPSPCSPASIIPKPIIGTAQATKCRRRFSHDGCGPWELWEPWEPWEPPCGPCEAEPGDSVA